MTGNKGNAYRTFRDGVYACVPTILGYFGIGIAAGVVGKSVGLTVVEIMMMSVFIYAGSAQFIICGMLALNSPVLPIILTTFLVNLRHFLMSMSVAPYFKNESVASGIGIGTLLTDESFGVLVTALNDQKKVTVPWTHGLNITAYATWILATGLGGFLGNYIPDPYMFGLDFALTGMFIGLFVLQVDLPFRKRTKQTLLILGSVCLTLIIGMRFFSSEVSVIIATLIGCLIGVWTQHE